MAQFSFDTSSVEKRVSNYDLLPVGWYTAQVTESDLVEVKTGNGQAIKLTFTILSDKHRGRKVWARLNVRHSNPKTESIAQRQLGELLDAIGIARMSDTVELHNKPVDIMVKVRKDDTGQYADQNEVAGFKPAAGGAAISSAPAVPRPAAPANTPAAGTAPVPPWQKRAA